VRGDGSSVRFGSDLFVDVGADISTKVTWPWSGKAGLVVEAASRLAGPTTDEAI
jgi:hypothetical protein